MIENVKAFLQKRSAKAALFADNYFNIDLYLAEIFQIQKGNALQENIQGNYLLYAKDNKAENRTLVITIDIYTLYHSTKLWTNQLIWHLKGEHSIRILFVIFFTQWRNYEDTPCPPPQTY